MSTSNEDFDLDEILDSALNEFENVEKKEEEKKEESGTKEEDSTLDEITKLLEKLETGGNADSLLENFGDFGEEEFKKMMEDFQGDKPEFNEMMNEMKQYVLDHLKDQGEDILTKEIYYEPIKDLETKMEKWLNENGESVSEEDRKRHQEHLKVLREIRQEYEKEAYSSQTIFGLLVKLEEFGSLPKDVLGDTDEFSPDQLKQLTGEMGENCNVM